MSSADPLVGLQRSPEAWALFCRQPEFLQQAYLNWWQHRQEKRAAHRDCLEAFVAGYLGRSGRVTRRKAA